jgi:chaperonin cofactor prefoldin
VLGYWEMAAALVNHGAIDEQMFYDTVGEHLFIYAKLQPFLKEIREQEPNTLMQVEKLIKKMPDSEKRLEHIKTIISRM